MKKPLLSICIATYNRADYISETLESIIPQLDDDVEILVLDGASTDDTEKIVKKYVYADPHIRYIRLPVKGGVDQDYDKSVELAFGEFCWLFTDDDLLKPGAVTAVKAAIKKGYGIIIVNAEVRNRELAVVLEHRRMNIKDNKIYEPEDIEIFFIDSMSYISFIGAVVIRRSIWLRSEREPYFGTEFIHVGVIFQKPLTEPVFAISEPYISIRYGNAQWMPRHFDIWMFKWPSLVWSFDLISDRAKQSIIRKEPWQRLKNLILYRARGTYTTQHYHEHFSPLSSPRLWKICAWFISRLPVKTMALMMFYYGRLIGANPLLLFDLKPEGR